MEKNVQLDWRRIKFPIYLSLRSDNKFKTGAGVGHNKSDFSFRAITSPLPV